MTTFSPALIGWPPTSVSSVAVRRKWITGVPQRTISSTAVFEWASKSPYSRSRWSGKSVNAFRPWLIALRVVSLPATTSRMKNEPNSCAVSCSPSTSACHHHRGDVVLRVGLAVLAERLGVHEHLERLDP